MELIHRRRTQAWDEGLRDTDDRIPKEETMAARAYNAVFTAETAAANMIELSEQVPSTMLLSWPGPARRIHGPATPPADPRGIVTDVATAKAPARPFDRCRTTSARIVSTLASKGVPARILRCAGWRGDVTPHEDPRWSRIPPDRRVHYVVHVPDVDMTVDATWRQFDASADPVRIGDLATTTSEWTRVEGIHP